MPTLSTHAEHTFKHATEEELSGLAAFSPHFKLAASNAFRFDLTGHVLFHGPTYIHGRTHTDRGTMFKQLLRG